MKRSGFKKPSLEEVRAKNAELPQKRRTPPKPGKASLSRTGPLRAKGRLKASTTAGKGKKRSGRPKLRSMKSLKKLVWMHFSIFVRTSRADSNGYVTCVTCSSSYLWNSGLIHAGHWMHNRLDYEERQIHPQCKNCNYFANTRVNTAYSVFMAKTYGAEVMEELELLGNTKGNRYTRDELEELLAKYKLLNSQNPLVKEN